MPKSYENLYNNTAERYVLGSVLINNDIMGAIKSKLSEYDFYNEDNQKVYRAMQSLFKDGATIDVLFVIEKLKNLNLALTIDPKEYLIGLMDEVPTTSNTELYVDEVKDKAITRELQSSLMKINDGILNSSWNFNELLDKTEEQILNLIKNRRSGDLLRIDKAAEKVYDLIKDYTTGDHTVTGIPTGYAALDRVTLGFKEGQLIILAARPSVGKSAFALNVALNSCRKRDVSIAFFSLEMSIEELMIRLYGLQSHISLSDIQKGNLTDAQLILLGNARQNLSRYRIYFDESNSTKIYDIRSKCRQLAQRGELDLVIIDYLQLITTDLKGKSRQEEVAQISRELKVLAKELKVPVIALSQLSRNVETREDKKPVLSDLRESGSIEQDADIVMFLYNPDDKKSAKPELEVVETAKNELDTAERNVQLIVAKNRQGALDDIMYRFKPSECYFYESKYTTREKRKPVKNNEEDEE